jgi:hypothetical protein
VRRTALWGALLAALAVAMAATPLTALLAFESSFLLGIAAALAGAHLGAERVFVARRGLAPSEADRADAHPARAVLGLHARATARVLALLVLPLGILSLNALRVKNCDLATGLAWYALLPGLTAATGAAAGVCAGLATRRRIGGTLAALAILLLSVGWGVWRFYAAPPVFGFDPFVGYFPGSLYDEEIPITSALLGARSLHLTGALAALLIAAGLLDGRRLRLTLRARALAPLAAGLALAALWVAARAWAQPELAPDARSLARVLDGARETDHLTLRYASGGPWARDIALHARDFEFRWTELRQTLGTAPDGKITCWLFDSAEQKRRYLGASHTQIAKPWRREIYLQHADWPHPVVKHELAHVLAGAFGDPIFHVARRGFHFSVGLIEGAAVAADDPPQRVSLDQQVKIMRAEGLLPPLERIFGPGFFAYSGPQAYTAAGSFCRFLIETRGAERFRALYRSAGDFASVYGEPLQALERAWLQRVDATPLSAEEHGQARERLRRPSVWKKVCAHELAERLAEAQAALAAGDVPRALALHASIVRDDPGEPEHLAEWMDALSSARREPEALESAHRLLDHPAASDGQKARALTLLGDAELRGGDPHAGETIARALALPLDEATARQLRARAIAARELAKPSGATPFGRALVRYLVGDAPGPRDAALDVYRAAEVVQAAPDAGLGHYLLGRQLAAHDRAAEALPELERALARGLPDPGFTVEARRLAASAALRSGDPARSRALWEEQARETDPLARAEAKDWIARCDFDAGYAKSAK